MFSSWLNVLLVRSKKVKLETKLNLVFQFIHLLTARFEEQHIENSKNYKNDIARIALRVCQSAAE